MAKKPDTGSGKYNTLTSQDPKKQTIIPKPPKGKK